LSPAELGVGKVEGSYEHVGLEFEEAAGSLLHGIISLFATLKRFVSSSIIGLLVPHFFRAAYPPEQLALAFSIP
jgi:hypothetical protein